MLGESLSGCVRDMVCYFYLPKQEIYVLFRQVLFSRTAGHAGCLTAARNSKQVSGSTAALETVGF